MEATKPRARHKKIQTTKHKEQQEDKEDDTQIIF